MWAQYKRKGLSEMRPYCEGDDMTGVSISEADAANGSPVPGDMIARNPRTTKISGWWRGDTSRIT